MNQITIQGENIIVTNEGNFRIHIKELFNTAGKIYKFDNNSQGLGISTSLVRLAEKQNKLIEVKIGKSEKIYQIESKRVRDILRKFNSIHLTEGGTLLMVIPIYELRESDKK